MNLQGRDLKLDLSGDDVRLLQSELTLLSLSVPGPERQQVSFGQGTLETVIRLQNELGLTPTGVVDAQTACGIGQMVDAITYTVVGTVTSPDHAGLRELHIQIVDKNVGYDVLLAETITDMGGSYAARFVATSLRERGKNANLLNNTKIDISEDLKNLPQMPTNPQHEQQKQRNKQEYEFRHYLNQTGFL